MALPDRPHRKQFGAALTTVLLLLLAVNLLRELGPAHTGLVVGPAAAVLLLVLARRHGLSWEDLGLSRRTWRRGTLYAATVVGLVTACYLAAAAFPATRELFVDGRYRLAPASAVLVALVVIPVGTVLVEEVAFRGVLFGLLRHHRGIAWATAASSTLFGLWHILPSLGLTDTNAAAGATLGTGTAGRVAAVAGVVVFTAVAGVVMCELRRRSGSILAAVGLHWATNGLGVLVAATVWAIPAFGH